LKHGVTLQTISVRHPLYQAERALRYRVLRQPLGLPMTEDEFPFEAHSLHLVATDDQGVIVGCVLFHFEGSRLYQMAVSPDMQGKGIGRQLVDALETELQLRGVPFVTLHAREQAAGFYKALGYAPFGDPFVEVGVPHVHMRKSLPVHALRETV
jgi:ribosomal protein S18 acetylase RimI-like enzyme